MNPYQDLVSDFHEKTGQVVGTSPKLRDRELRASLIMEEAVETVAAMGYLAIADIYTKIDNQDAYRPIGRFEKLYEDPNLVEVIDGLCDLLYVTFGTAVAAGIDLDRYFQEVHRSNLEKLTGPKRADGKQLKPEGWQPPRIQQLLEQDEQANDFWRLIGEQINNDADRIMEVIR